MMETLRKVVSDIATDLRATNLDDRFSFRFLASKFTGRAETILKQDIQDRNLLLINEIWKPLRCIELQDSSFDVCNILYEGEEILKKSKKKIPLTYATKYGNLLKIFNLNTTLEYKEIKPSQYKEIINREFVNKKTKYYWIIDGYIYIPDASTEEVKGLGVFVDSQEADFFNGDINCCYKPLDSIVTLPKYIIDIAKQDVVNNLIKTNRAITPDENPDLNVNKKI